MKTSEHKTGNWFVDQLNLYQSANSDSQSLKNNFVIRQGEFRLIIEDLRNKGPQDPLQHELLLGRRGSGKSTLLKRIQIEIDEVLTDQYLAVNLAEEQAGIYRLFDLWEEVLRELSVKWKVTLDLQSFESFDDNQSYTRYLYAEIHQLVQAKQKRIVLLLDNLDRILENFGGEGHLLREILLNDNDLVIIGGSTRMDEQFWKYDQPFYEFFRRHRLEALSSKEIHRLLHHWSEQMELPQLWEFSQKYPGKIETIRLLTDGLPRTLQFFIQILLKDSTLYGFDYLRKVMDNVTPLYQERLNHLPPAHRKIVQEMAFLWEACSVKQLVEKCRMESKLISAHLKQLSNAGIIEVIATSKKNNLYRLSERFFNMWLMITQGNPEQKRRAKWLTLFLEAWYDENQWSGLVEEHLQRLRDNELPYDRAIVLTKAMAQSKHIGTHERDQMIDLTAALQANAIKNDLLGMPEKFVEIASNALSFLREKKYQQAHQLVDSIENEKDGVKFYMKAFLCNEQDKLEEAEYYYLQAITKGNIDALNNLAVLYKQQDKLDEAEQYYLQAIAEGYVNALNNLANLYREQEKIEEAEQYYLQAIAKGNINALNNLANLYSNQGKLEEAEQYYLQAIAKGHVNALYNLANLYSEQMKLEEAEQYCLKAIAKGNIDALNNLAILYKQQNKIEEAEQYYLQAIAKENVNALNNLANLYSNQGKLEEAEQYYLQAIAKDNVNALYNLANLYREQEKIEEAEQYYLQAIAKEHVNALNNLANLYSNQGKLEEAEQYYLQAIAKDNVNALYNLANLYSDQGKLEEAEQYYLQAIAKGNIDALNNLAILYNEQDKLEEAEQYYLQAIAKGDTDALNNLAVLYKQQDKLEEAEQYYLQAIAKGNTDALNNLAVLYKQQDKLEEAEQYYLQAIAKGNTDALNNLANLYSNQEKLEEAEQYYLQAIAKGDTDALNNLAVLYKQQDKLEEAEQYYLQATTKGEADALYNLAVLYLERNINKEKAYELIKGLKLENDQDSILKIILEVWNNTFDNLEKCVAEIVFNVDLKYVNLLLNYLLYFEQEQLVLSLFHQEEKGNVLREKYILLYYATLLLTNQVENNLELRIPPEVQSTVDAIVAEVKEKQRFYA